VSKADELRIADLQAPDPDLIAAKQIFEGRFVAMEPTKSKVSFWNCSLPVMERFSIPAYILGKL
jgi:hypothetical protein